MIARCDETKRAWAATHRGQSAVTDRVERGADVCVARRELSVAASRSRRFSSFTLGLNQMASESSPARFRAVHLAPSSPRARLWPLPGRYVARLVSSGEVVAGAEPFRLRRPRPHARIQTRLFISSARAFMRDHCAREIANLPELGDGVLHRTMSKAARPLIFGTAPSRHLLG